MKQPVIRTVLIRECDLESLKKRALVKSEYGNRKLYDTIEWRPLTKKDFLIEMIKHPMTGYSEYYHLRHWITKYTVYQERYRNYDMAFIRGILHITPMSGKGTWKPVGLATLTKTFDQIDTKTKEQDRHRIQNKVLDISNKDAILEQ